MGGFWIRVINALAVLTVLVGYNQVTAQHERRETELKQQAKEEYEQWREENSELLAARTEAAEAAGGGYKDGTYTGSGEGYGGAVEVEVIIESGAIADIKVISAKEEDETYFAMARGIIPRIIEGQTARVDAASGATFSSYGIMDAVESALEEAGQ